MPGKMVPCMYCSKVMRSDNLKNHTKTHRVVHGTSRYTVGKKRKLDNVLSSGGIELRGEKPKHREIRCSDSEKKGTSAQEESSNENVSDQEEEEEDKSLSREHRIDVWKVIVNEAATQENDDVLTSFKDNILLVQSILLDETCQIVITTLEKAKENIGMDFKEALDYATDLRKFLILRTAKEAMSETEDEKEET